LSSIRKAWLGDCPRTRNRQPSNLLRSIENKLDKYSTGNKLAFAGNVKKPIKYHDQLLLKKYSATFYCMAKQAKVAGDAKIRNGSIY
jgi:predicted transcriptional regulator